MVLICQSEKFCWCLPNVAWTQVTGPDVTGLDVSVLSWFRICAQNEYAKKKKRGRGGSRRNCWYCCGSVISDARLWPLLDLADSRSDCRTPGRPLRLVPSKQAPNKYPAQPETVNWGGERDPEPSGGLNTNNIWCILAQKVVCLPHLHRTGVKTFCDYFRGDWMRSVSGTQRSRDGAGESHSHNS